jgi:NAD(P)-dependent dehydrogenase (short-subunit alcohol dehydrogenase family)
MEEVRGKVAVVTGAASGIGRGLASVFCQAGMKVVLADIEQAALDSAASELRARGADVLSVATDVADQRSVFALAAAAHARYGAVHVLCNNAGVGGATGNLPGIWNAPAESWNWMLGVNLMGVVHGLQAFVPEMLAHGEDGHIVNTSSVMGVWAGPGAIYNVSKHALTALTEGLYYDLRASRARIGVSLLLPGLVASKINTAARNWPRELRGETVDLHPQIQHRLEQMEAFYMREGMAPERVGEIALHAIRTQRFYVFTHPGSEQRVLDRARAIEQGLKPPALPAPAPSDASKPES